MQLLEVIPIGRAIGVASLSYFSKETYPLGSLLEVPVRGKTLPALLVRSENVEDVKSVIKKLPYEIRRIERLVSRPFLTPAFIRALERYSLWSLQTKGAILQALLPKGVDYSGKEHIQPVRARAFEVFAIQTEDAERLSQYKSRIREDFAKGRSVFIALPTIEDAIRLSSELSKGIAEWSYLLHGALPKKKLSETWRKAIDDPHPILAIATGPFLSLPRSDWGTFILERDAARGWKQPMRPFIDYRTFAEMLARESSAHCIYGDLLLRTETMLRHEEHELLPFDAIKSRAVSDAEGIFVSMRTKERVVAKDEKPVFKLVSDKLLSLLEANKSAGKNTLLLVARRGLSPVTLCADCSTPVQCTKCSAPVVLHSGKAENFFLCHRCGERRSAAERCVHCASWRLTTLGVGSEGLEKALSELMPESAVIRIDADTAKTNKQATAAAKRFFDTPGAIAIGTEMSLLYLREAIDTVAIVSIDSLFSLPDFRIYERALSLLLRARSLAREYFLVQTRMEDFTVFEHALRGTIGDFFKEELAMRKTLGYPPYCLMIKLSAEGKKAEVAAAMEQISEKLKPFHVDIFPAFVPGKPGTVQMHAMLKVEKGAWPQQALGERIASLPPSIAQNVEPDTLL
jgi:primosomal protein N'